MVAALTCEQNFHKKLSSCKTGGETTFPRVLSKGCMSPRLAQGALCLHQGRRVCWVTMATEQHAGGWLQHRSTAAERGLLGLRGVRPGKGMHGSFPLGCPSSTPGRKKPHHWAPTLKPGPCANRIALCGCYCSFHPAGETLRTPSAGASWCVQMSRTHQPAAP